MFLQNLETKIKTVVSCVELLAITQDNITRPTQAAITCSKLTIEALEKGLEYVQS